ncbi:MAG: hypothetical protein K6T31_03130, partial [Alicyclobacillus sp.]|nr:hypothetical protein [Alicyclobacillus sp.]
MAQFAPVQTALANPYSVFYYDGSAYRVGGGDLYNVNKTPPVWSNLSGQVYIAQATANGTTISHLDVQNAKADNGYLAIDPSAVSSWVSALGGNLSFVQSQSNPQQFSVYDIRTNIVSNFFPFPVVVNESGAIFTNGSSQSVSPDYLGVFTPNGGTYTDPSTGQTYPTYNLSFTVT